MTGQPEFHAIVAKVEERFRPMLDSEAKAKLGAIAGAGGGTEGKYEPKMVSTGWWVVLARFGIAVHFGSGKPDIEVGDTLVLVARKISKPKADGQIVVEPKPPPPTVPRAATERQLVGQLMMAEASMPKADRLAAARVQGFEGDPCNDCGHFTMVRNGSCLKCNTCGATSGCS